MQDILAELGNILPRPSPPDKAAIERALARIQALRADLFGMTTCFEDAENDWLDNLEQALRALSASAFPAESPRAAGSIDGAEEPSEERVKASFAEEEEEEDIDKIALQFQAIQENLEQIKEQIDDPRNRYFIDLLIKDIEDEQQQNDIIALIITKDFVESAFSKQILHDTTEKALFVAARKSELERAIFADADSSEEQKQDAKATVMLLKNTCERNLGMVEKWAPWNRHLIERHGIFNDRIIAKDSEEYKALASYAPSAAPALASVAIQPGVSHSHPDHYVFTTGVKQDEVVVSSTEVQDNSGATVVVNLVRDGQTGGLSNATPVAVWETLDPQTQADVALKMAYKYLQTQRGDDPIRILGTDGAQIGRVYAAILYLQMHDARYKHIDVAAVMPADPTHPKANRVVRVEATWLNPLAKQQFIQQQFGFRDSFWRRALQSMEVITPSGVTAARDNARAIGAALQEIKKREPGDSMAIDISEIPDAKRPIR